MYKFVVLAALVAVAMAGAQREAATNEENYARQAAVNALAPQANDERETNNVNAKRQHGVNKKALYFGAGVGTAHYYGVPGTDKKGYHNAHYAAPAYGAYGYGYHGAYNGAHHGAYNGYYGGYPAAYGYGYNAGYGAH